MKKSFILILKVPLLIVRWLNATVMRVPAAYAMSLLLFLILHTFIFDNMYELSGNLLTIHTCFTLLLSIVWGLIYTLLKLPIHKKIYKSKGKKVLSVILRVVYAYILWNVAHKAESDLIHDICLFTAAELVVNAVVVAIKGKTAMEVARKAQKAINEYYLNNPAQTNAATGENAKGAPTATAPEKENYSVSL